MPLKFNYIRAFLFALIFATISQGYSRSNTGIHIEILKCNYKVNPLGVGYSPVFSWEMVSNDRNQSQVAYQILVSSSHDKLSGNLGDIWNSGKLISSESVQVHAKDQLFKPGTQYFWKVKVWDKNGIESDWSSEGKFVTALFDSKDWDGAKWISLEEMNDSLVLVPGIQTWQRNTKGVAVRRAITPLFRKEFKVKKQIESAFLFISGLGQYEAYINGENISDYFLAPGWTHYNKTCLYNTFDITNELKKGENVIGIMVGNGFYNINNERYRKLLITYGMPKTIAKIKINYTDGSSEFVVTDGSWKTSPSPVTYNSLYGGETYNANLEQDGWNKPGFNDSNWQRVLLAVSPEGFLEPEMDYPVKKMESFSPKKITPKGTDTFLIDFGQNASGIVKIKVNGKKGDTIRIFPSELYYKRFSDNQKYTGRPYYFEYVLKGDKIETWEPRFTYYGFRYAHVIGAEPVEFSTEGSRPKLIEITMQHTYNSAPSTGDFWCSNTLFNEIDTLIHYGIQSNFQSVVTDCPHREKLGWIEQTYLMGNSIQYNYEVYHLYYKLVHDMMDSQRENGLVASIVPEYVTFSDDLADFIDSPEWGSAIVILPWLVYKWYGDMSLMQEAWPAMVRYAEYLDTKATNNILSYGLGDWYDLGPDKPGYTQLSPKASTATAIFSYDCRLLSEMAEILNKPEEAKRFSQKAAEIKDSYNKLLFNQYTKVYASGSQTSMSIPLCFGIVNEIYRPQVLKNLVDSILSDNKAVTAGDIGFHYLIEALTEGGQSNLIYEMNNRDDIPGYGYQIKKGATALTESWDALPEKSNNHLMLGHIEEWFYTGLGGIRQDSNSVAYKDIIIKPAFVEGLDEVKTNYHSPYGIIRSEWKNSASETTMNISIPVNTTAQVYLPSSNLMDIQEGNLSLKDRKEIEILSAENNFIVVKVGSGNYQFSLKH